MVVLCQWYGTGLENFNSIDVSLAYESYKHSLVVVLSAVYYTIRFVSSFGVYGRNRPQGYIVFWSIVC